MLWLLKFVDARWLWNVFSECEDLSQHKEVMRNFHWHVRSDQTTLFAISTSSWSLPLTKSSHLAFAFSLTILGIRTSFSTCLKFSPRAQGEILLDGSSVAILNAPAALAVPAVSYKSVSGRSRNQCLVSCLWVSVDGSTRSDWKWDIQMTQNWWSWGGGSGVVGVEFKNWWNNEMVLHKSQCVMHVFTRVNWLSNQWYLCWPEHNLI